jgi:o-succinylbenzoate synthase
MRRIAFAVPLLEPIGSLTERRGWLLEGPAGWGELSPLPSWSGGERSAAEHAAEEAAAQPFPEVVRDRVEVNVMIPRVAPERAAALAAVSGCRTAKVKVGDALDEARIEAVRGALGASARIRVDANGAWPDSDAALRGLRALGRFDLELVEDPVPSLEDLALLRRVSPFPVAAEMSVRTVHDARRLRTLGAADAVVIKPQRIGGVRAALAAAEEAGVPAIVSSALETSVGLAAVLAVAAAVPNAPFAHGVGTALLLGDDVTTDPLLPIDGALEPRRVAPDRLTEPENARA